MAGKTPPPTTETGPLLATSQHDKSPIGLSTPEGTSQGSDVKPNEIEDAQCVDSFECFTQVDFMQIGQTFIFSRKHFMEAFDEMEKNATAEYVTPLRCYAIESEFEEECDAEEQAARFLDYGPLLGEEDLPEEGSGEWEDGMCDGSRIWRSCILSRTKPDHLKDPEVAKVKLLDAEFGRGPPTTGPSDAVFWLWGVKSLKPAEIDRNMEVMRYYVYVSVGRISRENQVDSCRKQDRL